MTPGLLWGQQLHVLTVCCRQHGQRLGELMLLLLLLLALVLWR